MTLELGPQALMWVRKLKFRSADIIGATMLLTVASSCYFLDDGVLFSDRSLQVNQVVDDFLAGWLTR